MGHGDADQGGGIHSAVGEPAESDEDVLEVSDMPFAVPVVNGKIRPREGAEGGVNVDGELDQGQRELETQDGLSGLEQEAEAEAEAEAEVAEELEEVTEGAHAECKRRCRKPRKSRWTGLSGTSCS